MKHLYLDVTAGCAGDMLLGALYGLCPDPEGFLRAMESLDLPGVSIRPEPVEEHGKTGIHMAVAFHGVEEGEGHEHAHHHTHRNLQDVLARIAAFPLPRPVLEDACAVYRLIAAAEARAHDAPVAEVHFHEVGMNDAIADVVGVSWLLHTIAPDRITACPIAVGGGHVHCAHGVLPVPAPATSYLLEGLPTVHGPADRELCTPTGAALLRHFVTSYALVPREGGRWSLGFGTKRFPTHCNAVGARLAEESEKIHPLF